VAKATKKAAAKKRPHTIRRTKPGPDLGTNIRVVVPEVDAQRAALVDTVADVVRGLNTALRILERQDTGEAISVHIHDDLTVHGDFTIGSK
jgi:hypothetical protein